MYAQIIVDISHEKLDRVFEYIIPADMLSTIKVGMSVRIPFGKSNKLIKGYVVGISDSCSFSPEKLKYIDAIDEKSVTIESQLMALAAYIKENFGSTMNQALKTVLPVKKEVKSVENRQVNLNIQGEALDSYINNCKKKNAKAKLRLLEELKNAAYLSYDMVTRKLGVSSATLKAMEGDGAIIIEKEAVYRDPVGDIAAEEYNIVLNPEQSAVAENICKAMVEEAYSVHLIHGVTGSGKTEVYIKLIEENIKRGKDTIVMIPEISLTYQTVMRFYRKFGKKVTIINSKLSAGERYDQFERAKNGDVSIMIGPRSALFTPFNNLGLIIIDEEHEGAYKSESVPKYHAVDVAAERIRMCGGALVLGSATPSVDSYYKAKAGIYRLHELKNRAKNSKLAAVQVVDLRDELAKGNRSMFSQKLDSLIRDRLQKKEQIILFINRRGYAGFISCRKCGHVMKCKHCDVSLTAHNDGTLKCHYCGYEEEKPVLCPKCGSKYIGIFGTGTQKVEEAVNKYYPQARTLRMDMDTTSKKGGHQEILAAFASGEADILIGTQMIVKGHDFPNVTLVGIIAADLSMHAADYRAAERTFQLLTQAEGRAGRGQKEGIAIVQTYNPEAYAVVSAAAQDYDSFYKNEISFRKLMMYPPTAALCSILIQSPKQEIAVKVAGLVKDKLKAHKDKDTYIIGPADASVSRINDVYRKVIHIKCPSYHKLVELKDRIEIFMKEEAYIIGLRQNEISLQFDFNPVNVL